MTYSAWHRRNSTRRFVGIEHAQLLAQIDIDVAVYVEYDDETKEPLALVETAKDIGQNYKCATVTRNLARRAGLEAFIVLYTPSPKENPAAPDWPDIEMFRVKRICPDESGWKEVRPDTWAKCLLNIRKRGSAKLDEEWEKEHGEIF